MATIQELIDQHVASLEALAAYSVSVSASDLFDQGISAVVSNDWARTLVERVPPEYRSLSVEEYQDLEDASFLEVPDDLIPSDIISKLWHLPYNPSARYEGYASSVARSLDAITAKIEVMTRKLPSSDEMVQPLCMVALSLTACAIRIATQNDGIPLSDQLLMRTSAFCFTGMKSEKTAQNLYLLQTADAAFTETAKLIVPSVDYGPVYFVMDESGKVVTHYASTSWHVSDEATEVDPRDLRRAESFLRSAQRVWEQGTGLLDPAYQSTCRNRAASLGEGAEALHAIALGQAPKGQRSQYGIGRYKER